MDYPPPAVAIKNNNNVEFDELADSVHLTRTQRKALIEALQPVAQTSRHVACCKKPKSNKKTQNSSSKPSVITRTKVSALLPKKKSKSIHGSKKEQDFLAEVHAMRLTRNQQVNLAAALKKNNEPEKLQFLPFSRSSGPRNDADRKQTVSQHAVYDKDAVDKQRRPRDGASGFLKYIAVIPVNDEILKAVLSSDCLAPKSKPKLPLETEFAADAATVKKKRRTSDADSADHLAPKSKPKLLRKVAEGAEVSAADKIKLPLKFEAAADVETVNKKLRTSADDLAPKSKQKSRKNDTKDAVSSSADQTKLSVKAETTADGETVTKKLRSSLLPEAHRPKKRANKRDYPSCNALGRRECYFDAEAVRLADENRTEIISTVQCTKCQKFVHIYCINKAFGTHFERQAQFDRYEMLLCPRCSDDKTLHARVYDKPTNTHRQNSWEENPGTVLQTATPDFVAKIVATNFPDARTCSDNVLLHMRGRDIQMEFLERFGFRVPILTAEPCGLSVTVPETDPEKTHTPFTCDTVLDLCGRNRRVDCIDSRSQVHYNIELGTFVDYMTGRALRQQKLDHAILLNVVSLEFSDVAEMKKLFEPPAIVREMSWASSVMPADKKRIIISPEKHDELSRDLQHIFDYDYDYSVEYFCLMGAAGSFTDFHIDFGGSCVFYHIMRGKKVFYLAPPTPENMQLYRQYEASESKSMFVDGSDNFFKLMEASKFPIYRLELLPGNTVLLPAGWIHAVHTPEDSLVFGGNFLNHLCIPKQLEVYRIEEELKYPRSDRYHNFEINCVYAIDDLVYKLRLQEQTMRREQKKTADGFKQYQVHGLCRLTDFVEKLWLKKRRNSNKKLKRRGSFKRRMSAGGGNIIEEDDNDDGGDRHEESLENIVRRAKCLLKKLEKQFGVDSHKEPDFEPIPFNEFRLGDVSAAILPSLPLAGKAATDDGSCCCDVRRKYCCSTKADEAI